MFMFDVETLGKRTDSVLLSLGCIYFNPNDKPSPEKLLTDSFFVKFDVKEQIEKYNRTVNKSTIDWWAKQNKIAQEKSLIRKSDDFPLLEGIESFRSWTKQYKQKGKKDWIWIRGNLDQLILDAVEEQLKIDPIFYFNNYRDVRTAIDLMNDGTTGYCEIDYPGFSKDDYPKHDPVADCLLDVMMLLYGKSASNAE